MHNALEVTSKGEGGANPLVAEVETEFLCCI